MWARIAKFLSRLFGDGNDLTDLTRSTILSLMESVAPRISLSLNAAELWTMGSAMQVFLWKRVQKR